MSVLKPLAESPQEFPLFDTFALSCYSRYNGLSHPVIYNRMCVPCDYGKRPRVGCGVLTTEKAPLPRFIDVKCVKTLLLYLSITKQKAYDLLFDRCCAR